MGFNPDPKPQKREKSTNYMDPYGIVNKRCRICGSKYEKLRGEAHIKWCGPECAEEWRNKLMEKQKPIANRSNKRAGEEREYIKRAREFVKGKMCPVYPELRASQVHHMKGRIGELLLNEKYWLAVSAKGHDFIERNPKFAKKKGWSLDRLSA